MTKYNYFKFNNATVENVKTNTKSMELNPQQQAKFKKIIDVFDINKNGVMDAKELNNFWEYIKHYASQTDNKQILDSNEAELMLKSFRATTLPNSGSDFNFNISTLNSINAVWGQLGITVSDLFDFANVTADFVNARTLTKNPQYDAEMEQKTINNEMNAHYSTFLNIALERNSKLSPGEINRWNQVITTQSVKYNVPYEVLTAIIAKESGFDNAATGKAGCMQVTDFSSIDKDKYGAFKAVDPKAYADLKTSLKTSDLKDPKTGILAGIIAFKYSYAAALADFKHYKKWGQPDTERSMNEYKNGQIQLTKQEAREVMKKAMQIYNAGYAKRDCQGARNYATECLDRLDKMGYDYTQAITELN